MPKAAIFFFVILLSSTVTNSYGFISGDLTTNEVQNPLIFDSGIVEIDSNFFTENDFKRYLIFGNDLQNNDFLKTSSIYGIKSDNGFFYVSVLSENSASNLASQGYYIIEDSKLDFHLSDNEISDVSRIGDITGSNMAKKKFNATGNGTVIAIVDTGVDFSNPDIQHSVARDKANHPIMLDPDGQGIVLTNATFFAYIDDNEIIRNYSKPIPSHMTSSAYVTRDGVFLDVSQGGKGSKIPIYNSFFPQLGNSVIFNGTLDHDMKIGNSNKDYIKSKSGIYHLGVIYQGGLEGPMARIQVVPVLVVDSFTPGVYDTMIPDMSTSWEDYTRFDLKSGQKPNYDFDFTDEKPIVLGSGKEFLVYDSNNDGKNDYSAGTFGAQVLDVYGVIRNNSTDIDDTLNAINGTLLPAFDSDGEFFGLMTDFMGHGTSSTASITSRGQETYDIYNNSKRYTITGVAPDAKIVPVKALWLGDTVYGWLWSAGFENKDHTWKFSGKPRVDIISNSWGVSNFPSFKTSPGMDILSMVLSVLTTPNSLDDAYPGVTIVSSAGNSGHGYGTIGLPNASPFGISVGATTNNVFVGYGPFKDQPRFGNTTNHSNDVVDFSSRGPSSIGDPKPDVMSIGAHGFTPSSVLKTKKDSKDESFSLFGGTSMAAPLVSGSAAILIEEMKKQSQDYDPFLIKNILMSTATDLNSDPFTQGSGLTNIESALNFVHGEDGVFIVYNDDSYNNIKKILNPSIEQINSTAIGFEKFQLPTHSFPMTSWFAGQLLPGERTTTVFTIKNPTNDTLSISVMPQTLSLISNTQFNGTTILRQHDSILNETDKFIPNYVNLSDVNSSSKLGDFFNKDKPIPDESSLMILNLNFQFSDFMNNTSDVYADDIKIASLYLYDWIDNNNDTKITSDELSLVNRAGSWGTVQELRVSEPAEQFKGIPLVGVYPVPTRYSYWLGDTKQNSTSMDYTISSSYYEKEKWPIVWSESEIISVPPKEIATVDVTLIVPDDYQTGVYQGFLNFKSDRHTVNAPISFAVKQPVIENDSTILIKGVQGSDVIYGNGYTKGAFDMANRYMAGDWRQYYFDIQNESINSAAIEISWTSDDTNLSVFVMDPTGKIIQTNVPSGVFGHFLDWASLDWLGNSIFSQGGGFYPVKNKDDTSTVLYIPINQTGTYTLLTHSTLFGGDSITEPITLAAKFTNISPEMISDIHIDEETKITPSNTVTNTEEDITIINETKTPPKVDEVITYPDSSFGNGIAIGVVIGIAIGIAFIFIIRQKPPK
ncbi:peptidase families S8 and S53 [Candidatus Nitrosopumilus salaria BD31]|uniref:Peptidase families S8 and S53 n=1 Tax=Candidatus Nitrosopumilus salarius BD31 TaxID=859350 RepID=I3D1N1_9ARCH|nr:S8 family serine peptidase [Candidatus Nitrosopumilus salaria]EIJ65624.1 peptidase families S8 and S53 [Candidatus Nitrosopumilus salaria BD31]